MRDYLIFMSDQHNNRVMGCSGDPVIRTPNMDQLSKEGVRFANAYTPCPLCVPARMSMLTSKLPSKTGIFTNNGSIPEDTPTFLHLLANAGYETVLCGRMHFEGLDQRHGFTKRIAMDYTPTTIGADQGPNRGQMGMLQGEPYALQIVGGGNNPVRHYDRYVMQKALEYLSEPHEKPQCIFVGTYGPHSPYIADEQRYAYYLDKVTIPPCEDLSITPLHPVEAKRKGEHDPEVLRALRAAYYGCTEMTDELVGKVRNAFDAYLEKRQRDGVFVYVSDHGDMIGNRGFWGKASLYDDAEHIPFIIAGSGIPEGKTVTCPVSLMDLGPTICAMEGIDAELPEQDGRSLLDVIEGDAGREQPVLAEWMSGQFQNGRDFGRMVVRDNMKLITYHTTGPEADELFCLTDDLWEMHDLREEEPGTAEQLRSFAYANIDVDAVVKQKTAREDGLKLVKAFGRKQHLQNTETWEPTKQQAERPAVFVRTKTPLIPPMQAAWDAGSWAGADPGKAFPETPQ